MPSDPGNHQQPNPPAALRQIREAADALVKQGKPEEARELMLAAIEAVLRKNRDQELLIAKLRRAPLGQKSERIDPGQLWLLVEKAGEQPAPADARVEAEAEVREDAELDRAIDEAESAAPKAEGKKRKNEPGWKGAGVERQVHEVEPPAEERTCPTCGKDKACIGHDVTRRLELVPAHFVEHEYRLAKLACSTCKEGVTTAPAPPQVVERSAAGPSLLAHVLVGKFVDHAPLHRLSRSYARIGAQIPVSTLSDWVAAAAKVLAPLSERLARRVLAARLVRTDATGLLVLDPKSIENIVRGSMWCYVGDDLDVVLRYTPTGEGETGPWTFLAGRNGLTQADASNVFDRLFNGEVASAVEVGCWAHGRRRFVALQETDCRAAYPLKLIARLYRVEHLADARRLDPAQRVQLRQERSAPTLEKLQRWLVATAKAEPPSTDMAKAVAYPLNHWAALTVFLKDGRIGLDNNLCEQQLRDLACGRKNYLFAGSHEAARRAADVYSLTRTCLQYKVPPLAYFTDVLTKLAQGWPTDRLDDLLPHAWRTSRG